MSEVRIAEYKERKCDLSEEQMKEYTEARDMAYAQFYKLCGVFDVLRSFEEEHNISWNENKADVAKAYGLLLQMTSAGGRSNHVSEMRYEKTAKGDEIVYPVLNDGNCDWYTAYVTGDSGVGMIMDITNQFVRKAW